MLQELQFYDLDPEKLGYPSDQEGMGEEEDGGIEDLLRQKKDEDSEDEDEISPMQQALKNMDTDYRMDDQRKTAEMEMNIDEYKVEPTANQCMTDFYTFEHPTIDDIPAEVCGDKNFGVPAEDLPLNYYDNDDGFWDDYIQNKHRRHERAGLIVRRQFFQH